MFVHLAQGQANVSFHEKIHYFFNDSLMRINILSIVYASRFYNVYLIHFISWYNLSCIRHLLNNTRSASHTSILLKAADMNLSKCTRLAFKSVRNRCVIEDLYLVFFH